jgi:hypothetical protein
MQGRKDGGFGAGQEAFVSLTLFNPPQDSVRRKDGGRFPLADSLALYRLPGRPVYSSAKRRVTGGEFRDTLLLPMNLAFGKPGVKLTAYAWKERDAVFGSGYLGGLVFGGSAGGDSAINTAGPRISVRPIFHAGGMDRQPGLFVRNRVTARLPLDIEISVASENGINLIGTGPDEGLSWEVKGALSRRAIGALEGSFDRGTATVTINESDLKSGAYEMVIRAQDLLGNPSMLSVALEITDPSEIKLDNVVNVPNPVKMGGYTRFFYHHSNNGDPDVRVTIRVYSLGGRLLAVIRDRDLHNGYSWMPRDEKGNLLTPNVYLYQVTATSPGIAKSVKSKVKKLVVHPPAAAPAAR